MHPQRFKVLVEEMHRKWLSHVFGGITHHANGIDLRTDTFGIELKTRMRSFTLKNGTVRPCHGQFTLHEEQLCCFEEAYSSRLELYLCFLRYDFARPVRSLPQHQHDLVDLVSGREAWFVPWAFTGKYSVSSAFTGPYRYIPFRDVVTYALQCNSALL